MRRRRSVANIALATFASAQTVESLVQLLQDAVVEIVDRVSQLVRVRPYVVIGDESGDKLAVEKVVGIVDGARAPVSVVVRIGTRAKRTQSPKWRSFPVIVVLLEAVHVGNIALEVLVFAHFLFLLFRQFPVVVRGTTLSGQHGQVFIANVVPTEISVLAVEIRRLHLGQHVEKIAVRLPERTHSVVHRRSSLVGLNVVGGLLFSLTLQLPPRISLTPSLEIPLVNSAVAIPFVVSSSFSASSASSAPKIYFLGVKSVDGPGFISNLGRGRVKDLEFQFISTTIQRAGERRGRTLRHWGGH